ncbi:zinc-ribbon domain-containing protein [Peribacillus sp. NPDC097206]
MLQVVPKKKSVGNVKKVMEWSSSVNSRVLGVGCPYCSGRKVNLENCLATKNPNLLKLWNFKRNENIIPYQVTSGSDIKVWWNCEKGHEWRKKINGQSNSKGCPICVKEWGTSFPEISIYII